MRKIEPAMFGFKRSWPESILHFFDRVILPSVDDYFFVYNRDFDLVRYSPTDSPAGASFDEVVLRACVESVFSTDEFRMQDHVALLRGVSF